MRLVPILSVFFFMTAVGFGDTIYVPDDQPTVAAAVAAPKPVDNRDGAAYTARGLSGRSSAVEH